MQASKESIKKSQLQELQLALERSLRALEVEASLEKVRSASMAMQESSQLRDVVRTLYHQLNTLGFATQFVSIALCHPKSNQIEYWSADNLDSEHQNSYFVKGRKNHVIRKMWANWKKQTTLTIHLEGERKKRFDSYLLKETDFKSLPKKVKQSMRRQKEIWYTSAAMKYGFVDSADGRPLTAEKTATLGKFASVFEQTYTRFLDLQKAEAHMHEARIEAALKRVRAASMAMHQSQDLIQIAEVLRSELGRLGQPAMESCLIHEYDLDQGELRAFWIYRPDSNASDEPIRGESVVPFEACKLTQLIKAQYLGKEDSYVIEAKGKLLKEWYDQLMVHAPQTVEIKNGTPIIPKVLFYHFAKFSGGALLSISEEAPSLPAIELQSRAANVFELAYVRFLDLKRAEAQTKEAQIEAALDRVRARTMAMHQSGEFEEVVAATFHHLRSLDLNIENCGVDLSDRDSDSLLIWIATPEQSYVHEFDVPYIKHRLIDRVIAARQQCERLFTITLDFSEKKQWFQHVMDHTVMGELVTPERKQKLFQEGNWNLTWVTSQHIGFLVGNFGTPYSSAENKTILRFAEVFEQSYTRFLDIKKAEAQVREAQIEAALERIRSASLAMHKSDDLSSVVEVVFKQFQELNIDLAVSFIGIHNWEKQMVDQWHSTASSHEVFFMQWPMEGFKSEIEAWQRGEEFVFISVQGDEAVTEYVKRLDEISGTTVISEMRTEMGFNQIEHTEANHKYGNLGLMQNRESTEEERAIVKRFSKVFEQAYTRFLDLQKAEAQAREAQIEAALERVRSASMAMHRSHELPQVALTVFNQLTALGIENLGNSILLVDEKANTYSQYSAHDDLKDGEKVLNIIEDHRWPIETYLVDHAMKSIRQGATEFTIPLRGKNLQEFIDYTRENVHKERGEAMDTAGFECVYFYFAIFHEYSSLVITSVEPLAKNDLDVLHRMARTFGMSFQRYLDLQKAEKQAREAQIEAAMERVRAASMAMHSSDQFTTVAAVLADQIEQLGIKSLGFSIHIIDADQRTGISYTGDRDLVTGEMLVGIHHEYEIDGFELTEQVLERIQAGENLMVIELEGAVIDYLIKEQEDQYGHTRGLEGIRKVHAYFSVFHQHSFFSLGTKEPLDDTQIEILRRLTDTFRQSYVRLLDLQRAEAQAREAQIEAALERVRASTMAMHQSTDLADVATELFYQLRSLGSDIWSCGFVLCEKDNPIDVQWMSAPDAGLMDPHYLPHAKEPNHQAMYDGWLRGDQLFHKHLDEQETRKVMEWLFTIPSARANGEKLAVAGMQPPPIQIMNAAYFTHGYLLIITQQEVADKEIISRFAQVFDQTYTRFLDLQKAEEQAREAEIEASLERVRAASMAMHSSADIADAALVFLQQLGNHGIPMFAASINITDEDYYHLYVADNTAAPPALIKTHPIPNNDFWLSKQILAELKIGTKMQAITAKGKKMVEWMDWTGSNLSKTRAQKLKSNGLDKVHFHVCRFHKLSHIILSGPSALSDDDLRILERFADTFSRSYQRYLDIVEAEHLARQAQIESAIDKVRSASMAMHTSEELPSVIGTIYDQLTALDLDTEVCQLNLYHENSKDLLLYVAVPNHQYPKAMHVPYVRNAIIDSFLQPSDEDEQQISKSFTSRTVKAYFKHILSNSDIKNYVSDERRAAALQVQKLSGSLVHTKYGSLAVGNYRGDPLSEEHNEIIHRMAIVFEQAYQRFLDIRTAEEQAREAQIEAALERVRAAAMAMHDSQDLSHVVKVLRNETSSLGQGDLESCLIQLYESGSATYQAYYSFKLPGDSDHHVVHDVATVPWKKAKYSREVIRRFEDGEKNFTIHAKGKMLAEWYGVLSDVSPRTIYRDSGGNVIVPEGLYYYISCFSGGFLSVTSYDEVTIESQDLLDRAAKTFDLAYQRYLDLKKAEAQAREAQIEAALEKVRSSSMAMHSTAELKQVVAVFYQQVSLMKLADLGSNIHLFDEATGESECFLSSRVIDELPTSFRFQFRAAGHPLLRDAWTSWKKGEPYTSFDLTGPATTEFADYLFEHTELANLPSESKNLMRTVDAVHLFLNTKHGQLHAIGTSHFSDESIGILRRFATVFEQAYTRFRDLEKAETRAHEAQIEAALERVRNHTIAMDSSGQVTEVVASIHKEMHRLGTPSASCYIYVVHDDAIDLWLTRPVKTGIEASQLRVDWRSVPALIENNQRWSRGETYAAYEFKGKEVRAWYKALESGSAGSFQVPKSVPDYQQNIEVFSGFGGIGVLNFEKKDKDEVLPTLTRFGKSFEQVYTRFRDLQKAESQAREAQIEAALERIRSTALAMHHSSELINTVNAILEQITLLGIPTHAVHIYEFIDQLKDYHIWASAPGQKNAMKLRCPPFKHPIFERWQAAFDQGEDHFSIEMGKGLKNQFFRHFFKNSVHDVPEDRQQHILGAPALTLAMAIQEHTGIAFIRYQKQPLSESESAVMKRLAVGFEQAYTRFLDLQRSEAHAREAVRDAALDRIRAEIASMRTAADLERITPLVWKELNTLDVPFFRCGVFIIDDSNQTVQAFLSTPEGESLAALTLPFSSSAIVGRTVEQWRDQQILIQEWDQEEFIAWTRSLADQGLLDDKASYQGQEQPPDHLALHFVPFAQGMLYVGHSEKLSSAQLEDVQDLAQAFTVAYARYEDFNRLENTLKELQATQDQLIQSEKMASLGELTAGIAHEIQNPLNFVNNFSEVSGELIFEIQEELEKPVDERDQELIEEILEDLTQNVTKINHHGSRASGIVKGMLDHSRTSSGEKTPTDINGIVDEYLRLAYHGLRAKDKSFQAKFSAELDPDLPLINVVAQDIGRVILNLINNAFYTVHKKKLAVEDSDYMPTVTVSTASSNGTGVKISVNDNGQGMPPQVVEKIFQPFYSTKPTGEGTGLGLSLSYDIVTKGHGGTLDVESNEGVGSEFVIKIPIV